MKGLSPSWGQLAQRSPRFLALGLAFRKAIFPQTGEAGRAGVGFRMIQAHYIEFALYFYYYDIGPASDHQASDPGVWGQPI